MRTCVLACALIAACISCSPSHSRVTKIPIDGRPSALALADGRVWVADDENSTVHVIDAREGAETGSPLRVRLNPVAMAASGSTVWVAHSTGYVSIIDASSRHVTAVVRTGGSLTGIAAAGGGAWATDLERDDLVSVRGGGVRERIHVRDGAVRVCYARGYLWVSGREDTVTRVDPSGDRRQRRYRVGAGPIGIASDGVHVWTADSDSRSISLVGSRTRLRTGRGPVAVAVSQGSLWAANQEDGTITRFDSGSPRRLGTIPVGLSPRGIVADGRGVWTAGTDPNGVARVEPP